MTENNSQTVFIIDDDDAVRDSLLEMMEALKIDAKGFASAIEFLEYFDSDMEGCIVLDIRMPEMSGLELQKELNRMGSMLKIVIITGHGDIQMAVDAMKGGALDFIQKPFREQELIDCIQLALKASHSDKEKADMLKSVERMRSTLTAREKEVLQQIGLGKSNKVIAMDMGISSRTVENHRASIMDKMNARTTAELIKIIMVLEEGS